MSMNILIDPNYAGNGWKKRQTGAAVVTAATGVLTTTAGAGEQALMDYYVPATPGMRVEASAIGRWISGVGGIYLDTVNNAGTATNVETLAATQQNDFRRYQVDYTIPLIPINTFLRVTVGVPSGVGDMRWHSPVISIDRGYGVPIVIARGLLSLAGGGVSLNTSFRSHGVQSVAFNGTDTVTVTLEHAVMTSPSDRPLVTVSGTPDDFLIPLAGTVGGSTNGTFLIKWTNGAAIQNVSAGTRFAFFEVSY